MSAKTSSKTSENTSSTTSKKPRPVVVGSATAYAVRPPSERDGRWYWQCLGAAAGGKRATLWAGRATPDEVAEELAKLVVRHGARPEAEAVREAREVERGNSVATLLAMWMAHVRATPDKYSPNTLRNYESVAAALTEHLGGYAVKEVTPALLERYHSARVGQGTKPSTISFALRALRTAWNWGLRNEKIGKPWPKPGISLRNGPSRERPEGNEADRVLAILRRDAPVWCYRLARIIGATGMRVSEAWGLTVGDLELLREGRRVAGGSLLVRDCVGVAKTGARHVAIDEGLAGEVAAWTAGRASAERLIGNVTQNTAGMASAYYLRPAVAKIGGSWHGWHAFRFASADAYAEARVDPVVAAAQLGHTVPVMQAIYRKVRPAQRQAAANALAAFRRGRPVLAVVNEE
jgi:integrase